ncbi:hypothetical protein I4L69_001941 [Enterococcus faecium]|nr:hypothetical protein [Enterococcus faecium]
MDKQLLFGLVHLYDPETDTTSVSWSYQDDPELEHFVLEYYDENRRTWVPYDNYMGIIKKESV